MDLSAGESIIYQGHPSWRSTLGLYIKGLFLCAILGAIAAGVSRIVEDEVKMAWVVVVFLVSFLLVVLFGYLKRIGTQYTITTRRLHIRRGILNRATEETRVERIQNANTTQSFLERVLRVGTVDFDVASDERAGLFKFQGVESPQEVVRAVDRAMTGEARSGGDPAAPATGV
ncbi:PH domain-containing protein [Paraconexibacter sp.]|uniref:PH domain-containing protein n=1 Tax=Paraconexibacter sp. TaxID=2949640 RepID=UPI0035693EBF